jgi:hypothetical protein
VNVLDALERLLPQFELDGNVELHETSVEVALKSVRVTQIDGVNLLRILGSILQVISQKLTETTEFSLASILLTELEGLMCGSLVHDFQASVVLEDVENGAVCLP